MNSEEVRVAPAAALLHMFRSTDGPIAYACLEVLQRLRANPEMRLTQHRIGLVLDELEIGVLEDDVWAALVRSGAFDEDNGSLSLVATAVASYETDTGVIESVLVEEVIEMLEGSRRLQVLPPVAPTELPRCVERVGLWARSLLAHAAEFDLPGFPVFWQREENASTPLGMDVGSMASVDTAALLVEPARYGWPVHLSSRDLSHLIRAWRYALSLGVDCQGDWYDGAIRLPQFDDDFVGSFLPTHADLGSCPTTEAVANRILGLIAIMRVVPDAEEVLVLETLRAIEASVGCLGRWQLASGSWANHRYQGDAITLPPRDVSCQYAAEALVEVIRCRLISDQLRYECVRQLRLFADFAVDAVISNERESWWNGDFVLATEEDSLRSTTLLGLVIGRIGHELPDDRLVKLQGSVVNYIMARWTPKAEQVFESTFRSPTWDGPALTPFTWDMVRDGFILAAALDWVERGGGLDPTAEEKIVRAVEGVIRSEYFGAWLDVPMLREGKRRAFVSNSLHNLRAVLSASAWYSHAFPVRVTPDW
jgi:hypothetical protein